jgi:hypothetical protein
VFNGIWSCDLTIPQASEAGTYPVGQVLLIDNVANDQAYSTTDLEALGFPTQLEVTYGGPGPDVDTPVLTDFDFNPKQVDVSAQSQDVTCTVSGTDNIAGIVEMNCIFFSPSRAQLEVCPDGSPDTGDRNNGTWSCTIEIPAGSELGVWEAEVRLIDDIPNAAFTDAKV